MPGLRTLRQGQVGYTELSPLVVVQKPVNRWWSLTTCRASSKLFVFFLPTMSLNRLNNLMSSVYFTKPSNLGDVVYWATACLKVTRQIPAPSNLKMNTCILLTNSGPAVNVQGHNHDIMRGRVPNWISYPPNTEIDIGIICLVKWVNWGANVPLLRKKITFTFQNKGLQAYMFLNVENFQTRQL